MKNLSVIVLSDLISQLVLLRLTNLIVVDLGMMIDIIVMKDLKDQLTPLSRSKKEFSVIVPIIIDIIIVKEINGN